MARRSPGTQARPHQLRRCIRTVLPAFGICGLALQLAALRFPTGLGLGGGIPLAVALAAEVAPAETRGRLVILTCLGVGTAFTLGGLLASRLVALFGWPAIFVMGGLLPLAMAPALWLWLPESPALGQERHQRQKLRRPDETLLQRGWGNQ